MAILIDSLPPGLTFQDLVGGSITDTPLSCCTPAPQERNSTPDHRAGERRLRIYLPEAAMREMTLTEYREFLVSYRITNVKPEDPK